jgi:hypothetical protein
MARRRAMGPCIRFPVGKALLLRGPRSPSGGRRAALRGRGAPRGSLTVTLTSGLPTRGGATTLARRAFGGIVHALCKGRRTMACAITSMFLMAMFGIVMAAMVFRPSTKEKPSARRQETPVAASGDRMTA